MFSPTTRGQNGAPTLFLPGSMLGNPPHHPVTRRAEWQYGRAPSNYWGIRFQHIFYLPAKWRRSFPRPACRTRLWEGFRLQSLSYCPALLAPTRILLPSAVTRTVGGRLQSTLRQKGGQVLIPTTSVPTGGVKDPGQVAAHFDGAYILGQGGSGDGGDGILILKFKFLSPSLVISFTFIFTKAPWGIPGTGEMGLSRRGKPVWRRRKENSLHLHPTPRAVKRERGTWPLGFQAVINYGKSRVLDEVKNSEH